MPSSIPPWGRWPTGGAGIVPGLIDSAEGPPMRVGATSGGDGSVSASSALL